jgi:hypothetical protein
MALGKLFAACHGDIQKMKLPELGPPFSLRATIRGGRPGPQTPQRNINSKPVLGSAAAVVSRSRLFLEWDSRFRRVDRYRSPRSPALCEYLSP